MLFLVSYVATSRIYLQSFEGIFVTSKPVFIEFLVISSNATNLLKPRSVLVNLSEIASVEDIGDKSPLGERALVTLFEPMDDTVEGDTEEQVVKGRRTLAVTNSYESIQALLSVQATVVRPIE